MMETWLSGRKRLTANEVRCKNLPGFESLRLRNDPRGLLNAVRVEHHCARTGDEKAGDATAPRRGRGFRQQAKTCDRIPASPPSPAIAGFGGQNPPDCLILIQGE